MHRAGRLDDAERLLPRGPRNARPTTPKCCSAWAPCSRPDGGGRPRPRPSTLLERAAHTERPRRPTPPPGCTTTSGTRCASVRALRRSREGAARRRRPSCRGTWEAWHNLGRCYHDQERLDEAAGALRRAIALGTRHRPATTRVLGDVLTGLGRLNAAAAAFRRAIELGYTDHDMLTATSQSCTASSASSSASRSAAPPACSSSSPTSRARTQNLAVVLAEFGRFDESRRAPRPRDRTRPRQPPPRRQPRLRPVDRRRHPRRVGRLGTRDRQTARAATSARSPAPPLARRRRQRRAGRWCTASRASATRSCSRRATRTSSTGPRTSSSRATRGSRRCSPARSRRRRAAADASTRVAARHEPKHDFDVAVPCRLAPRVPAAHRSTTSRTDRRSSSPTRHGSRPGATGSPRRRHRRAARRHLVAQQDHDRGTAARVHTARRMGRRSSRCPASRSSTCSTTTASASSRDAERRFGVHDRSAGTARLHERLRRGRRADDEPRPRRRAAQRGRDARAARSACPP